ATTGSSPQHPSAPAYRPDNPGQSPPAQRYERPSYELTFTCKPCGVRSTHVVSKQAYHHGTTLVRCPGCKDRHVITDHLKIFNEKPMSFEDILAGKGVEIKKAFRTDEDTIEFIDD
ncbi:DNL zinc finger-domain-containing protein, partial [Kalaharituber pfeilii]